MPYVVEHRDETNAEACPVGKPWGVYTQNEEGGPGVGSPHGCHETKDDAQKQQAALYVALQSEARVAALDDMREIRSAPLMELQVDEDSGKEFEGYAAIFDEEAELEIPGVGIVTEDVKRGAFRSYLATGANIPMLYHHLQEHPPLATVSAGTLRLEEDTKGLRVRANIADHYIGQAVRESVKRRDIPGMSWGFVAGRGNSKIERRDGNRIHRTLTGFKKILDISPTWDPTYRGTEAQFRSRVFPGLHDEDLEQFLTGSVQQLEEPATLEDGEEQTRSLGRVEEVSGADWEIRAAARARQLRIVEIRLKGGLRHEA